MNLEDLRERRRREREQDSLQALPESFYADVADYVAELKAAREQAAEAAADPYGDPEVRRLTDELQTVQSVVESLYERRVGKVVKGASFAAADMPHEREGLTEEERALFDDLVDRIKENRTRVLDRLAGEGEPTDDGETDRTVASDPAPRSTGGRAEATDESPEPDPAGMLADAMGGADDRPDAEAAAAADPGEPATLGADDVADPGPEGGPSLDEAGDDETAPDGTGDDGADERTTVRITADVGEIYGVDDRSYRLEREDVVDLPADNAAPLVEKDAAERL